MSFYECWYPNGVSTHCLYSPIGQSHAAVHRQCELTSEIMNLPSQPFGITTNPLEQGFPNSAHTNCLGTADATEPRNPL